MDINKYLFVGDGASVVIPHDARGQREAIGAFSAWAKGNSARSAHLFWLGRVGEDATLIASVGDGELASSYRRERVLLYFEHGCFDRHGNDHDGPQFVVVEPAADTDDGYGCPAWFAGDDGGDYTVALDIGVTDDQIDAGECIPLPWVEEREGLFYVEGDPNPYDVDRTHTMQQALAWVRDPVDYVINRDPDYDAPVLPAGLNTFRLGPFAPVDRDGWLR